MPKALARLDLPKPEEANAVVYEAILRLDSAAHSFHALMTLLYNGSVSPAPKDLYHLLQPLSGEVDAALDELHSICVTPTH